MYINDYENVVISVKGEQFLKEGQMLMYRNNLDSDISKLQNGQTVNIISNSGEYFGTGFLSKNSHITVRILTKDKTEKIDEQFFHDRFLEGYNYRKTIMKNDLGCCRLVFGDADFLPGLTVDRYNDVLVTQISSYGMETRKDMIYKCLISVLEEDGREVNAIYERNEIAMRKKEGLQLYKGFYLNKNNSNGKTVIRENGILLNVDYENGQKTGYFLDQKNNRYLLQKMSKGKKVLDCFSHTGGFALNAAYGNAEKVTAVDVSQTALNQGKENAVMNGLQNRIEFVQDDVFEYLDKCHRHQFDIIVLDPPAFTKSRSTIDHAYNGYKEINLKAMKLLSRGGYLFTCSCSSYMDNENFEKMLMDAAQSADVSLKQISVSQQNSDHPILWNMQQSSYLKFYIFQII